MSLQLPLAGHCTQPHSVGFQAETEWFPEQAGFPKEGLLMNSRLRVTVFRIAIASVVLMWGMGQGWYSAAAEPFTVERCEEVAPEFAFHNPFGGAFAPDGSLVIVEYLGGRVLRLADGRVQVIGGDGTAGYAGDGGPLRDAVFNGIHNVEIAPDGIIYLSDTRNNRVRAVSKSGVVQTIAGDGTAGFAGDGGPARSSRLNDPISIALTPDASRLLIADINNRRVRAIDLQKGLIQTLAGNGRRGAPAEGASATETSLYDPRAAAMDRNGNLYILERSGHALRVVRPDGRLETVAGSGKKGDRDGAALQAELNGPKHLCLDRNGDVIIADAENHLIRLYRPSTGQVTTLWGIRDGKLPPDAPDKPLNDLARPHGVWLSPSGDLFVADSWNDRVLKLIRKN